MVQIQNGNGSSFGEMREASHRRRPPVWWRSGRPARFPARITFTTLCFAPLVLVLAGCGSGIGASSKAQVGFACGNVIPPALPRSGPGITARFEDASDVVAFTNSSKSHTTYGVGVTYGSNPNDGGSIQGYFLDDDKRTVVSSGYVTADVKGLVTTSPNEDVPAVEQPKSAPGSTIRIAVTKLMNQCDNNGETTAKPIAAGTYWFSAALSVFRLSSSGEPRRTGVLYATEPVKVHVG